jgi:hypothetical protein
VHQINVFGWLKSCSVFWKGDIRNRLMMIRCIIRCFDAYHYSPHLIYEHNTHSSYLYPPISKQISSIPSLTYTYAPPSSLFLGPPIILSPETGVGLKEGAKTGLSTLVCGICFFVCTFFSPLFAQIPSAGTMPMLFMVRTVCTY